LVFLVSGLLAVLAQADDNDTQVEVDAYWQSLARTVRDGDAAAYRALYHADAVVVMVESGESFTIDAMMKKWTPGFEATAAGKMQADVEDRFNQRIIGENTAWESGVFHYWTIDETGKRTDHYVWFDSLLVKKNGQWLQTMELQKKTATLDDWKSLGADSAAR
jgi:uncharacterized protein (TIGR02246 family)